MLRLMELVVVSAAVIGLGIGGQALAVTPFSIGFAAGGTWNSNYAQGFSPYVGDTSGLISDFNSSVFLTQFQFFKSGTADTAANFKLVIVNSMYPQLSQDANSQYYLPASAIVGVSTNTIASSSTIATGQPITFAFNKLQLRYGNDYAANFVTVGNGGNLYPVLVSTLTANYANRGTADAPDYYPTANYGNDTQYQYSTSNFITAGYYNGYSYGGDSNFSATFDFVRHGDFTGDGVLDLNDLTTMLQALTDLSGYQSTNNLTDQEMVALGDYDGDGAVTNADIQGLINSLLTGAPAPMPGATVPEPDGVICGVIGLVAICAWRLGVRRKVLCPVLVVRNK